MEATMYEDGAYNNFPREVVICTVLVHCYQGMEATMYEDGAYNNFSRESLSQMKRKLTLDLNNRPPKKQRPGGNFNPLLTSPDLNQLKLASPELERLIMQQGTTVLANNPATPSTFFFPKAATEEQEEFARGFVDTLEQLHHHPTHHSDPLHVSDSHIGLGSWPPHIKEEPQTVPSMAGSPPMSPIDMDDQERIKLERKRLRNRIAASKCRRRKLERIVN